MEHRRNPVDIAQRVGGNMSHGGMLANVSSFWLEQFEDDHLEASAFMVAMLIRSGAPVTDGVLESLVEFVHDNSPADGAGAHLAVEDFHLFSMPGACGIASPGIDPNSCPDDVAHATAAIAELMSRAFEDSQSADPGKAPKAVVRFLQILSDQQRRMAVMQAIVDADAMSPMMEIDADEDDDREMALA